MILAGDIGGTKTSLAFYADDNICPGGFVVAKSYPSQQHKSLSEVVEKFLAERREKVTHAGFGVAGPVVDGRCEATNLPWVVDASELARQLKLERVALVNDLEANAHGISVLLEEDFECLHPGVRNAKGNAAVISAGTGLGEAGMYWDGKKYHPFGTEGGHSDFAPRNEAEDALLVYLRKKFGRVSYERVVSGMGIVSIYEFLRDTGREKEPEWLKAEMKTGDAAAVISTAALEKKAEICERTLDIFVSAYGAEAGNVGLKMLALGGVYLGGGIAPKILPKLKEPGFVKAFLDKGRLSDVVEQMPVKVILNERTALLGAAKCAVMGE